MRVAEIYNHVIKTLRQGAYKINGDEAVMACPNCGDDVGHFSVNIINGKFNCFKCPSIGGSLLNIISTHLQEWKSLTSRHSANVHSKKMIPFPSFKGRSVYDILFDTEFFQSRNAMILKLAQKAYDYCMSRGMTPDLIRLYQVCIIEYDPRIYFIYWEKDEVTYWMGRAFNNNGIKTVEPANSIKPLFGRHIRKLEDTVVLVEGVFDHFATPDSYAIMGSNITDGQIQTLRRDNVRRIILIGDPDADEQMEHNAFKLRKARIKTCQVSLLGNKDPSDIGPEMMSKIVSDISTSKWALSKKFTVNSGINRTDCLGSRAAYVKSY